ncbi:MAG: hypothetical protein ACE5HT_04180 [Gemmatimonadales bacterium]
MLMLLAGVSVQPQVPSGVVEGVVYATGMLTDNAVVYMVAEGKPRTPLKDERAVIDQVNLRFVPTILVVQPGAIVEFRNSDPILHNVFSPDRLGDGFDLGTYPRNSSRFHTFNRLGPHVILCHVHPEMAAYVVVVPTQYHAVVPRSGRFRIQDITAGRYKLRVWHRSTKPLERSVVVRSGVIVRVQLELERK